MTKVMSATARSKQFRETLWFAKGQHDQEAADEAARSGDALAPAASDLMPIEDRYADDGNVRPSVSAMFSLRTGNSLPPPIRAADPGGTTLNNDALIGDLKRGRGWIIAVIVALPVAIAAVVLLAR